MPGDIVMADQGFRIDDGVFYQAKLVITDLTRGESNSTPWGQEHIESLLFS